MVTTNKRTQTLGLHQWNEDDTILCYYYTKYGLKNLMYDTEEKLSGYIGTTLNSLRIVVCLLFMIRVYRLLICWSI